MSKSTFLQLCQKFQRMTGITGSEMTSVENQTGIPKKIVDWIPDADNEIQGLWQDWRFLIVDKKVITVNSGQDGTSDEYSLTALGVEDILNRWDPKQFYINPGTANYATLTELKHRDWMGSAARLGVKNSAQPSQFVIRPDNSLVFVDKPNAEYTVWAAYFKSITKMSANGSMSNIPAAFENIIIFKAQMKYAAYYEDDDLYLQAEKDYNMELVKLEAAQLPEQHSRTTAANYDDDSVTVVL